MIATVCPQAEELGLTHLPASEGPQGTCTWLSVVYVLLFSSLYCPGVLEKLRIGPDVAFGWFCIMEFLIGETEKQRKAYCSWWWQSWDLEKWFPGCCLCSVCCFLCCKCSLKKKPKQTHPNNPVWLRGLTWHADLSELQVIWASLLRRVNSTMLTSAVLFLYQMQAEENQINNGEARSVGLLVMGLRGFFWVMNAVVSLLLQGFSPSTKQVGEVFWTKEAAYIWGSKACSPIKVQLVFYKSAWQESSTLFLLTMKSSSYTWGEFIVCAQSD